MTEEEWRTVSSSGRLMEHARRVRGLRPAARARKFRLVGVEILRAFPGALSDDRVAAVLTATERMIDGDGSLADVAAAIRDTAIPS